MKKIKLAVVGATGVVGMVARKVLEEKKLPIDEYIFLASKRSAGEKIEFMGKEYIVRELTETSFDEGIDYAIFSAGGDTSKKFSPIAAAKGCIVVDNSSAFRMDENVPLVVPEVNPEEISNNKGIIANPNCSTIQCVVPLFDLYLHYGIREINYTTYQSVSGIGREGLDALERCYKNEKQSIFPYNIKFSCIPYIGKILANNYSEEEIKMINETKKIFNDYSLEIDATCVRVPIKNCHLVSVNVTLDKDFEIEDIKSIWSKNKSIILKDDSSQLDAYNNEHIYVGRVKKHLTNKKSLSFICVADNLTRGAAYNAYEILDYLVKNR